MTEEEIARGTLDQFIETGDGCYIDNAKPDELRCMVRFLVSENKHWRGNHDQQVKLKRKLHDWYSTLYRTTRRARKDEVFHIMYGTCVGATDAEMLEWRMLAVKYISFETDSVPRSLHEFRQHAH